MDDMTELSEILADMRNPNKVREFRTGDPSGWKTTGEIMSHYADLVEDAVADFMAKREGAR